MFFISIVEILKAFLYGIVEGITEWLPVSSTGHMILLDEWFKLDVSKEFWDLFLVVIQLGAILAIVVVFFKKLWPFGKSNINIEETKEDGSVVYAKKSKEEKVAIWKIWRNIVIACLPAAIIGLLFDDWLDEHFYNFITVAIMLIFYGIIFIVLEIINKKREFKIHECAAMSWRVALIIGLIQLLALIPGTSRSGVTILGAMIIGLDRSTSAEFSFFLSIPVMLGASLLKGVKYFASGNIPTSNEWLILIIGCVVAFVVSILVIKFLMFYIKKHDFKIFGIYRILLGIILIIYYIIRY